MRISDLIDNPEAIIALIQKYEGVIATSEDVVRLTGKTLEAANKEQAEFTWKASQALAESEGVVKLLEAKLDKLRAGAFRKIKETSDRALADRTIEKYVDDDQDVLDMLHVYLELKMCRDKLAAVVEAFKARGYALKNIVEVRVNSIHQAVM